MVRISISVTLEDAVETVLLTPASESFATSLYFDRASREGDLDSFGESDGMARERTCLSKPVYSTASNIAAAWLAMGADSATSNASAPDDQRSSKERDRTLPESTIPSAYSSTKLLCPRQNNISTSTSGKGQLSVPVLRPRAPSSSIGSRRPDLGPHDSQNTNPRDYVGRTSGRVNSRTLGCDPLVPCPLLLGPGRQQQQQQHQKEQHQKEQHQHRQGPHRPTHTNHRHQHRQQQQQQHICRAASPASSASELKPRFRDRTGGGQGHDYRQPSETAFGAGHCPSPPRLWHKRFPRRVSLHLSGLFLGFRRTIAARAPSKISHRTAMAPSDDCRWKSAVDPRSGRTYYYHEETRETQWRKPMELASSDERRAMEQKEQRQKDFFAAMEANILNSMSQGVVPGGVRRAMSRSRSKVKSKNGQTPMQAPEAPAPTDDDEEEEELPALVRTISAMDETILRDVCRRQPSFRSMSLSKKSSLEPGELGMDGTEMAGESFATLSKAPLDPLEESIREIDNNSLNDMFSNLPLEDPGASDGSERDGSESRMHDSSVSGFGLTWEETQALKKLAEITKEMADIEHKEMDIVRVRPKEDGGAANHWKPRENNKSKDLPRELDFDDSSDEEDDDDDFAKDSMKKFSKLDHSKLDKPSGRRQNQGPGPAPRALPREMDFDDSDDDSDFVPTPIVDKKQSIRIMEEKNTVVEVERKLERPAVTRRNTCGTLYVGSTMSAPDKDATIKCICGVYRAHMLSAEKDPLSGLGSEKYNVFNDQESEQGRNARAVKVRPPSLEEVSTFYRDIFFKAQMESDCIIMSLIYVERLIKRTNGELRPRASNWRSLLFSCMILSSKVWDDLSMWNADFSQSCPPGVSFPLKRINDLELAILNALSFQVKVLASEYAKYYFLLRSMLIKSGLGGDEIRTMNPLDVIGARRLQQVSTQYEETTTTRTSATIEFTNRSKSLTVAEQMKIAAKSNAPGKLGLEHVVKM